MTTVKPWAAGSRGTAALDYAQLIINRVATGMPNDGTPVDWANAPLTVADYADLPLRLVDPPATGHGLFGDAPAPLSRLITDACHSAYGITSARINVNLNDRPEVHARVDSIKWGRGTASGGGRYCIDAYLIHGGDALLTPGIYHYSVISNGWERLTAHDSTGEVRRIQRYPFAAQSYLVLTIHFWRSAFKYNDFAYQATAMDIGTFIGSQHELLGGDIAGTWDFEVDELALSALLGLDPRTDGVYAVQPWGSALDGDVDERPVLPSPHATAHHRDRAPRHYPTTAALQRAMSEELPDWQTRDSLRPLSVTAALRGRAEGRERVLSRETSFGRFSGEPLGVDVVTALLDACREAADDAVAGSPHETGLGFLVYAHRVDGLEPGLHIERDGVLVPLALGDQSEFLESTYFLRNYMGRKAACTVILCGAIVETSRRGGVRGYRTTNAMIGAACQSLLSRARSLGVATGTALGFDSAAHAAHAGLDPEALAPMLMIMLGVDAAATGQLSITTREEES